MRVLKSMSWNDKWSQYIMGEAYGGIRLEMLSPERVGIIFVMQQLREGMTVYEAFLKGVEAVAGRESIKRNVIKQIAKAEKQRMKDAKSGFLDEVLEDYIKALRSGLGENGAKEIKVKEAKKDKEKGTKNCF